LMMSKIGTQYDPKTGKGTIGRNFHGQFNITFLGARGFFKDKKFNMAMGAGALGATFSDLADEHIDNSKTDFIHGGGMEIRQDGVKNSKKNRCFMQTVMSKFGSLLVYQHGRITI